MTTSFDPDLGAITVSATLHGPIDSVPLRLLLDTGARFTLLSPTTLQRAGYQLGAHAPHIRVATATGIELMLSILARRLDSLDIAATDVRVVAHALPTGIGFDGLLGLNFFRSQRLTIDFRTSTINLE